MEPAEEKHDFEVTQLYRVYVEGSDGDKVYIDGVADFEQLVAASRFRHLVSVTSWNVLYTWDADATIVRKFAEKFRTIASEKGLQLGPAHITEIVAGGDVADEFAKLAAHQCSYLVFISGDDPAIAQSKLLRHRYGIAGQTLNSGRLDAHVSNELIMLNVVRKMLVVLGGVAYVPRLDRIREELLLENMLIVGYTVKKSCGVLTLGYSANVLSHAYAFKAGFFFVDGFGGQCEELMTNLLRHLAENRAPGPLPGHVLIIRKGNNADLNAIIDVELPAFHRAIEAFSESYRPNVAAFLFKGPDKRVRTNADAYRAVTNGVGVEFATATNGKGLREFSVQGHFLGTDGSLKKSQLNKFRATMRSSAKRPKPSSHATQPKPTSYVVVEDEVGLTSLEAMSLMRLLCYSYHVQALATRDPNPVRQAERMVKRAQNIADEL
ncbi:hypothetical protein AAVH_34018, partial [Aphelenchoides avenae]